MKKIIFILSIISIILLSGCISDLEEFILDRDIQLPDEVCSSINSKVIVIYSDTCGACHAVMPLLEELDKEYSIDFEYINLSEKGDVEKIDAMKLIPKYTPTVIAGCKVMIGVKSESEYRDALNAMKW